MTIEEEYSNLPPAKYGGEVQIEEVLKWMKSGSKNHLAVIRWPSGKLTSLCKEHARYVGADKILLATADVLGETSQDEPFHFVAIDISSSEFESKWADKMFQLSDDQIRRLGAMTKIEARQMTAQEFAKFHEKYGRTRKHLDCVGTNGGKVSLETKA